MTHITLKIPKIILTVVLFFSIWQIDTIFASSIITPQPIFNTQQTSIQNQNRPSNKVIQKSQKTKEKKNKKTTKPTTKPSVKKNSTVNKTTKPKTVNKSKNTASKNVNSNSKTDLPKNWERYITPPIIIITLILASILRKH